MLKDKVNSKGDIDKGLLTVDFVVDFLNSPKKRPIFKEAALV